MAEQRDDGKPGSEPGTDIEPKAGGQPAPQLDEEQLRQFQQFQQFQDYLKFTEAQNQGIVPSQPAQPVAQPYGQPPAPPGPPPGELVKAPRPRAPRWLRRLGGKVVAWLIAILLIAIAGTIVYRQIFPSDTGKTSEQIASEGGGTYKTNKILTSASPFEAVRSVYDGIAQHGAGQKSMVDLVCGKFEESTQQQFAIDVNAKDCRDAVERLHSEVKTGGINDYAESISKRSGWPPGDVVVVKSCDFTITGGPALGDFTVSKVQNSQWLITGHAPGPKTCPPPAPSTTPS
ncbi:hypothetical protein [Amycolatopsis pittospori]|uniref:hypothetical protein n=1 Tax=Amycolatopsis pittospori TaxID=2749434 RepID=UPI0015F0DBBB|nr:hypothetical protein [Amycolatopsis pittospori]